jgi:hypothetical protein
MVHYRKTSGINFYEFYVLNPATKEKKVWIRATRTLETWCRVTEVSHKWSVWLRWDIHNRKVTGRSQGFEVREHDDHLVGTGLIWGGGFDCFGIRLRWQLHNTLNARNMTNGKFYVLCILQLKSYNFNRNCIFGRYMWRRPETSNDIHQHPCISRLVSFHFFELKYVLKVVGRANITEANLFKGYCIYTWNY